MTMTEGGKEEEGKGREERGEREGKGGEGRKEMESKGRQGGENKNKGREVGLVGVPFECKNVPPWPRFCVQGDGKVEREGDGEWRRTS